MDMEDELLEMADGALHSDISEESKREVSPKMIDGNCHLIMDIVSCCYLLNSVYSVSSSMSIYVCTISCTNVLDLTSSVILLKYQGRERLTKCPSTVNDAYMTCTKISFLPELKGPSQPFSSTLS